MSRFALLVPLFLLPGCDLLEDVLNLKAPTGGLSRVDLVTSPSMDQFLGWGCYELGFGDASCVIAGFDDKPKKNDMLFSFDLVFDLSNPNANLPIPLVELLLGFTVFEGQNLGAACLTFCDPDKEDCVATTNAVGSCELNKTDEVKEAGDLIPTVEDMFELAETVATGEYEYDNEAWRYIPGGGGTEAHIQFDLGIDVFLDLADELLNDAVGDFISGRNISLEVPYSADGTMFFQAPELGRKGIGFGPFESIWDIEPK